VAVCGADRGGTDAVTFSGWGQETGARALLSGTVRRFRQATDREAVNDPEMVVGGD